MGFKTVVLINNNRMHSISQGPERFVSELVELTVNGGNIGGDLAKVYPSIHGDHNAIYVHIGGTMTEMDIHSSEFERLARENPEYVERLADCMKDKLKQVRDYLKTNKPLKK